MLQYAPVALNWSPIQYGMELNAKDYVEKHVYFREHRMLYYQFKVNNETGEIPVVPDGCIDIFVSCNPSSPNALIYGTVLKGTTIYLERNTTYFCIRFTPKQSMSFRSLSFRDVVNTNVSLMDAIIDHAEFCYDLATCHTFEERIAVFERSCLSRLFQTELTPTMQLVSYSLGHIYRSGGAIPMKQLAEECGYSDRYLRRRFEETLGISPKLFSRIVRFQNALAHLLDHESDINDAVSEQHFYDQSHFLKEFKQFSLFTPTQIRDARSAAISNRYLDCSFENIKPLC